VEPVPVGVRPDDVDHPPDSGLLEQAGRDRAAVADTMVDGDRRLPRKLVGVVGELRNGDAHRTGHVALHPLVLAAEVQHVVGSALRTREARLATSGVGGGAV
jgi:hypothetical protein